MSDNNDGAASKLAFLLIGGGIGAILALLFAPKSGRELRGDIADVTRKGIDYSREQGRMIGDLAGDYYERAAEKPVSWWMLDAKECRTSLSTVKTLLPRSAMPLPQPLKRVNRPIKRQSAKVARQARTGPKAKHRFP